MSIRIISILSALLFPALLMAQTLPVHIIAIVDGDTVKVKDKNGVKYIVSLSGVDAPEIQQDYGTISKDELCKLICDQEVVLSYNKLNTQGHVLSTVYLNGIDVNHEMLERGMAWQKMNDKDTTSRQHYNSYAKAENSARVKNVGLWKSSMNVSPWRWRQINHQFGNSYLAHKKRPANCWPFLVYISRNYLF